MQEKAHRRRHPRRTHTRRARAGVLHGSCTAGGARCTRSCCSTSRSRPSSSRSARTAACGCTRTSTARSRSRCSLAVSPRCRACAAAVAAFAFAAAAAAAVAAAVAAAAAARTRALGNGLVMRTTTSLSRPFVVAQTNGRDDDAARDASHGGEVLVGARRGVRSGLLDFDTQAALDRQARQG